MLTFRYRKDLSKKEINEALKRVDKYLGQTLFVESASIKPDGGIIEVQDDDGNWRVVVVSEAKHQGKDIENFEAGKLLEKIIIKISWQRAMLYERAYKNVNEIANFMLSENYFPYILFLEGSNFLTQNVIVTRPDGRKVTLVYNDGMLNRLDRINCSKLWYANQHKFV